MGNRVVGRYFNEVIMPLLRKVAAIEPSPPVLVSGETGTGKGMVARFIHDISSRKNHPFVSVNCGAIPPELIESELFGHVQGSFTGATKGRTGKFLTAGAGTIFLDEIGEMPISMQAKLLHVLEDHQMYPVGSDELVPIQCSVICATNRDLGQMIKEGKFRADLYYRIGIIPLTIPPLRDRPNDLFDLIKHFLQKYGGKDRPEVAKSVLDELMANPWRGNVRELENHLYRLCLFEGVPGLRDLMPDMRLMGSAPIVAPVELFPPDRSDQYYRGVIVKAFLEVYGGNRASVASVLQLSYRTILRICEKAGIVGEFQSEKDDTMRGILINFARSVEGLTFSAICARYGIPCSKGLGKRVKQHEEG